MPLLSRENQNFEFGKGRVIKEGKELAFISTGETVYPALQAAKKLQEENGIRATVVSMHTIKPLDVELLAGIASTGAAIITTEEHSIYGGLGEACASFLFKMVGLQGGIVL